MTDPGFYIVFPTPFGPFALAWALHEGRPRVLRAAIPSPGGDAERTLRAFLPRAERSSCAEIDALRERLKAFFGGAAVSFDLAVARLDLCSPFQQRVLRAEHAVPRGQVTTYKLVGAHLGAPSATRAVGTALARNPFPILVPCHRAIRADGSLGGYQGGLPMKRALLEMEGVVFDDAGRVVGGRRWYAPRTIVVCDYDPQWAAAFRELAAVIGRALGAEAVAVEHVGSTSVPGLAAKPILDIAVVIASAARLPAVKRRLAGLGYFHQGDLGIAGREAFGRKSDAVPRDGRGRRWPQHYLYVCPRESPVLAEQLAFRDYLRAHPEAAADYGALKRRLACEFPHDIDAYVAGKCDFVRGVLRASRKGAAGAFPIGCRQTKEDA